MTQKLCSSCRYWKPIPEAFPNHGWNAPDFLAGGQCNSPRIDEDYDTHPRDALRYSYSEGGWFWTGPEFGCVAWEAKS